MKTKITLLSLFVFAAFLAGNAQMGQLANGNFDYWTGNDPTGWYDIDQWLAANNITGYTLISEDTTSVNVYPGCHASAKLETTLVDGLYSLTGLLSLGPFTINSGTGAISISGIPYAYRPDSISFEYKYELVSPDSAQFGYSFTKWNGTSETLIGGIPPGYVDFLLDTGSDFHRVVMSPAYASDSTPDSLSIFFISGGNNSVAGNTLWLDTIEMIFNGVTTDVNSLNLKTVVSLFPVPASATLNVAVSEAMLGNSYSIFDLNGQVIKEGIIESLKSTYDVSQLAGGSYIFAIYDSNHQQVNQAKFIVAK